MGTHRNHHGDEQQAEPRRISLRDLEPGVEAVIVGYAPTSPAYRSKLLSMGLTRGTTILIKNIAPLGDPVHVCVRDFEVSLRRDEADALILEPVAASDATHEPLTTGRRRRIWRRAGRRGARGFRRDG